MENLKSHSPESLSGKNVLVTGATTGIGRATALLLSGAGANLVITGLTPQHMDETIRDLDKVKSGAVFKVLADLATEEGIEKVFSTVDENFNKLDILINNAALPYGSVTEGNYKEWSHVLDTNLLAYLACSSAAVKRMNGEGHIVNIDSMSADVREDSGSVYVATKSGIQGFSESLRKQVNKDGIKVTLIEPGAVDTDMQELPAAEKRQKVESLEMLTPDDIAACVLYCLSQPKRCDVVDVKIRPHKQLI